MTIAIRVLAVALAFAAAHPAAAQRGCGDAAEVSVHPERPRQGTLFLVRLRGTADDVVLSGAVAGEPLHFHPDSAGRVTALAAAPIDSTDSLNVLVACATSSGSDTLRLVVPLVAGDYPLERLRVAPRFSAPPDSALAARLAREAARAAQVSARSHETPPLWTAPFVAPRSARVTSRFGRGREFNGTVTSRHMGTDFAGATGAPVRAANRGVVRLVDDFYLGGKVVYVDHGAGVVTAYLHLSEQTVAEGDTVARGTRLGRVGATGRVTGPHLHFIVRYGRVTVDPQSFLSLLGGAPATAGRRRSAR